MGFIDRLTKRFTGTTYPNKKRKNGKVGKLLKNPYIQNQSTWHEIYKNEGFVRGKIDARVNATIMDWFIDNISDKDHKKEINKLKRVLTLPQIRLHDKMRGMAYKLNFDSYFIVEVNPFDKSFYVLNSEDCELIWNEDETKVIEIHWRKLEDLFASSQYEPYILKEGQFVIGSRYDIDTNNFAVSTLHTAIPIANILYHARNHNLQTYRSGGIPSMLYAFKEEVSQDVYNQFVEDLKTIKAGENLVAKAPIESAVIGGFNKDMEYDKLIRFAIHELETLFQTPSIMSSTADMDSQGSAVDTKDAQIPFMDSIHQDQKVISDVMTEIIHILFGEDDITIDDIMGTAIGRPKETPFLDMRFKLRKYADKRQLSAIHKIYLDAQVLTPNEVRSELGYEPREGGDEVIGSSDRMASGNTGGENPSGQDREPNAEDEDIEGDNSNTSNVQRVEDGKDFPKIKDGERPLEYFERLKSALKQ